MEDTALKERCAKCNMEPLYMGNLPVIGVGVCLKSLAKVPGIRWFVCLIFLFSSKHVAVEGLIWMALQSHLSSC